MSDGHQYKTHLGLRNHHTNGAEDRVCRGDKGTKDVIVQAYRPNLISPTNAA